MNTSPGQMRAARLVEPRRIEIVDAPVPDPNEGEVRVKVEGCGVCASNIPPYEGREDFRYPMTPGELGHEAWGTVDAVGRGVTGFQPGDRVGMLSHRAFADYDTAEARHVVKLPKMLGDRPFPGEPLAAAINIFRRSGVHRDATVAVVGIGFLGALLCRLAIDAGARVVAMTRRPSALRFASAVGATTEVMDDQWRIVEACKREGGHLGPGGADVVIECVGRQWPLDVASELVREHGRLVIAGFHQDGARTVNMRQWNLKGLDVINAHEHRPETCVNGMRSAVEMVADGRLAVEPLLTHAFTLDRLAEALELSIERPEGFLKAWIRM